MTCTELRSDAVRVGAIVLAAGLSRRMGRPKPALAWSNTTIVGQIVKVLAEAGAEEIVVVTGGAREEVEAAVGASGAAARCVFNPEFERGEMLSSLQAGLRAMQSECDAALMALGDQPQIQVEVVRAVMAAYRASGAPIVAPSYQMRRGHPTLLARPIWDDLLRLTPPATLRDFLAPDRPIYYVVVDMPSILADVDTPEDYRAIAPATVP